mgnify:CR=1 FL=1
MRLTHFLGWLSLLAVCACVPTPSAGGASQPLFALNMNTPEEVARTFLDAWAVGDINAMYAQLSTQAQERYAKEAFEARYGQVHNAIAYKTLTYRVRELVLQGTSAQMTYDVMLQTDGFGEIADPNRIMRLTNDGARWGVAWSSLDILDGLAGDMRLQVDRLLPPRANIYDRNGFAMVQEGGTIRWIAVIKQDMRDVEACITLLSRLMIRNRADMQRLFARYNADTWFHVGELDPEVYNANLNDINASCAVDNTSAGFRKTGEYRSRRYVGVGAATHVTGYVGRVPADQLGIWQGRGFTETDLVGLMGIENSMNAVLAGKPNRTLRVVESGGAIVRQLGSTEGSPSVPVQLTIDWGLQLATARAVNDAYNYAQNNWARVANGTGIVVMSVKTGEILALFSYPTFDPSLFNPNNSYTDPTPFIAALTSDRRSPLSNKAVQEQYTPGSVYKVITTFAAADAGIWSPTELFDCTLEWRGQERYGDALAVRQDWRVVDELPAAGEVTMLQALAASCNPFFWEMGALMFRKDPNLLVRYSEQLGLGKRSGFNALSTEAGGNLAPPQEVTQAINNAIGQGDVQTTALQMARAVATIANGGTLYQPYIVKQVGGFDGTDVQETFEPRIVGTVDAIETAFNATRQGMCLVTTDRDLGTAYRVFNGAPYSTCGKTGTAQAGVPGSGVPPHAWYVAFAPAEDPEIAIAIVTANSREGSEVSAPMVRRILDYYFGAPEAPFPSWWEGEYVPVGEPTGLNG